MSGNSPEYRREYVNKTRALLKELHICRECGEQDAYTLNGRTVCADCAAKLAEYKRKAYSVDGGQKNHEHCKARRERLKAEHKCPYCGRDLPEGYAYITCEKCRAKMRIATAENRRKKGTSTREYRMRDGWCFSCNKRPALEGKKLCRECYDKRLPIALANLEKTRGKVHPWRNQRTEKGLSKVNGALQSTAKCIPPRTL